MTGGSAVKTVGKQKGIFPMLSVEAERAFKSYTSGSQTWNQFWIFY